jgi:hypothetical protein
MILNNKKGQHEILFFTFQLLLIVGAFAFLMWLTVAASANLLLNQVYLARDLGLISNTIMSAPGDTEYIYLAPSAINISIFEYRIRREGVEVIIEKSKSTLPLFFNLAYKIEAPGLLKPENFYFAQTDFVFRVIREIVPLKIHKFKYPYIKTTGVKKEIIVAFYDENELANTIKVELGTEIKGIHNVDKTEMLIIVGIDDKTSKTLKIEIPFNDTTIKKSRKLASLIMNNALEEGNIDNAVIIPSTRFGLNKGNVSVYISLSKDVPIKDVSQKVRGSIDRYYS